MGDSFNSCHCCIVDDVADGDGDVADGDDDDDVGEDEKIIPPLRGGPSVLT